MTNTGKRYLRNWTAQKITRALHEKGVTHEALAARLGKGRSTVSLVVGGRAKSAALAAAIAAEIGTTPDVIWPRIYPAPMPAPASTPDIDLAS